MSPRDLSFLNCDLEGGGKVLFSYSLSTQLSRMPPDGNDLKPPDRRAGIGYESAPSDTRGKVLRGEKGVTVAGQRLERVKRRK